MIKHDNDDNTNDTTTTTTSTTTTTTTTDNNDKQQYSKVDRDAGASRAGARAALSRHVYHWNQFPIFIMRIPREFKDVVFEDVVFDNNRFRIIL